MELWKGWKNKEDKKFNLRNNIWGNVERKTVNVEVSRKIWRNIRKECVEEGQDRWYEGGGGTLKWTNSKTNQVSNKDLRVLTAAFANIEDV
jgi:hypothetical protein